SESPLLPVTASSIPSSFNTPRGRRSPAFAVASTDGNRPEKSGGGHAFADRTSSSNVVSFHKLRIVSSSGGSSPASFAPSTALTALRPTHCPDPSSEIAHPHPPDRAVF